MVTGDHLTQFRWRTSILAVENPGPRKHIRTKYTQRYTLTPFLPYILKHRSHIWNLLSGIFFTRIMPPWCANNFQYSIIWNSYHFHDNSEQPLRHPTALSIIKPALSPSSHFVLTTFSSPSCRVVREMNLGLEKAVPFSLKEVEGVCEWLVGNEL